MTAKFELGQVVATPGATAAIERSGAFALRYLDRHAAGDWGDVDRHDAQANDRALEMGARLLSAYRLPDGITIWIITEWDRSVTTILLPSEY